MDRKLKPSEIATLKALMSVTDGDLAAHVPLQAIQSKFKKHMRHIPKKALKILCRLGFAIPHPTKGGMTYNITREGKDHLETIGEI